LRWIDLTERLISEEVGLITARITSQNSKMMSGIACAMVQHSSFVCDGRTCGSEIHSDANLVFYVNASRSERVNRRVKDTAGAEHFSKREALDAERLLIPPGAIIVETTGKTKEESLEELMRHLATRGLVL
jgi:cytidylate kinase